MSGSNAFRHAVAVHLHSRAARSWCQLYSIPMGVQTEVMSRMLSPACRRRSFGARVGAQLAVAVAQEEWGEVVELWTVSDVHLDQVLVLPQATQDVAFSTDRCPVAAGSRVGIPIQ